MFSQQYVHVLACLCVCGIENIIDKSQYTMYMLYLQAYQLRRVSYQTLQIKDNRNNKDRQQKFWSDYRV